jgi:glycosyltransferase involved in cell wall biosynthesis
MVADPRTTPELQAAPRVSVCAPKRLRIGLLPYDSGVNLYAERLRANLSELGDVVPVGTPLQRITRAFGKKPSFDLVIAGWLENALVSERGRISALGLAKMIVQTVLLRAQARRVIYVRHNRYPHNAKPQHARALTRLLDAFEHLYDITLTHSPAETAPGRAYCPHPLYDIAQDDPLLPREIDLLPGYFVVFGRIARYKNIEALIEGFPDNQRLLVAGVVDDEAYARRLIKLQRPNVVIVPGYLSEGQAQSVLRRAAGVVVSHSAEDVIVTGSFFYAISSNKPVYAVETPFLRAIRAQVGPAVLQTAADVSGLCRLLGEHTHHSAPALAEWNAVRAAFSDTSICQHLSAIFERLGLLPVSEQAVSHAGDLADVAE